MVCVKNYENASTFAKVIPRKLLASFFRTRCIYYIISQRKARELLIDSWCNILLLR